MSPSPDRNKIIFKDRPPIAGDINKAISHHFQSKKEEQTAAIKHYPEWDVVKGEPLIELMRVERELLAAEEDLETKRFEYNSRRHDWEIRWKELREKHKLLKHSFLKFDEFIKENREKRERAERKISDEKERQKIREVEIAELERTLGYMEKIRAKMQHCVKEYEPFQKYLESVLWTEEFQSIAEIFNRYDTLIAARTALIENQDGNLQALENTSVQLKKMTEDKSQSLMDLNSRLAHLQGRHKQARTKALHWETIVAHVKEVVLHKELEDTQVRACIWNLYRQICTRKDIPVEAKRGQLEQQLLHIKRTIIELGKIVRASKRRAAKEEKEKELKKEKNLEEKSSSDNHGAKLTDIKSAKSSIGTTRSFGSSIGDSVSLKRI